MINKLWGGRFTASTHPEVEVYTASIKFDNELAQEDILGSLAHAAMLLHCKIINSNEYHKIQTGLVKIANKIKNNEIVFRLEDEDIHMNIERLLHNEIGECAGKLHTARSRNDQVALDIHLYLRKQIIVMIELLLQLQKTLMQLAKKYQKVILPGYTHLQRAQPIILSQHFLAYVAMLQRDVERLKDCWARVNICPLGAAALAGTSLPIDKHYVAYQLGFDNIYLNTMDAVSNRDFIIEFLSACSLIMMHLSRLSEEIILWSSEEFNFISLHDAFCTGSSIMPQKKNPDVAELARGKTGRVYGALFSVLTLLKGLPLAYNKDLQEDKEPLFDTVKTVLMTLKVYIPMLTSLKVNESAMLAATEDGFINATALAEYLVKKQIPFRVAHEIVGKMVNHCITKNCKLQDLTIEELQHFSANIDQAIYQILDVNNIVMFHEQNNSAKNSSLNIELTTREQQSNWTEHWLMEKIDRLTTVFKKFDLQFDF